jgi:hypothetical protein
MCRGGRLKIRADLRHWGCLCMYHPSLATIDGEGGARAKAACTETIADKTGPCAPTRSQRDGNGECWRCVWKGCAGAGGWWLECARAQSGRGCVLCVLRERLARVGSQDRIAVIVFFERDCRVQCNKLEAFGKSVRDARSPYAVQQQRVGRKKRERSGLSRPLAGRSATGGERMACTKSRDQIHKRGCREWQGAGGRERVRQPRRNGIGPLAHSDRHGESEV